MTNRDLKRYEEATTQNIELGLNDAWPSGTVLDLCREVKRQKHLRDEARLWLMWAAALVPGTPSYRFDAGGVDGTRDQLQQCNQFLVVLSEASLHEISEDG